MGRIDTNLTKARRPPSRRAFSLVELLAVLAIIGLVTAASFGRFGSRTVESVQAETYVRKLAVDLRHARRRTIATGDNHYLALTLASGKVASYVLTQRASGGDVAVDAPRATPAGIDVAASSSQLEFDFDGSALGAYSVDVSGPARSWSLSVAAATGAVQVSETPP
ncbi:MAG: prepilin-type N-terminal cleavage/methylation domain-containing protein [Pirellulales bacterium]|nr:prepilin-type N-terminal cleavage/methylation domain-containing protein [Pirellulales bacterium]